jgi:amino acid permease
VSRFRLEGLFQITQQDFWIRLGGSLWGGSQSIASPLSTFLSYTLQYLIVLPLEIIAGAFTTNYWNPDASKSIFIILFFFLILGINLLGVKGYGEAEFIFSAVKITAVMGFM